MTQINVASSLPSHTTVPADLINRPQWVAWRQELRNGKPTKVPFSAITNRHASTTNPTTWATFVETIQYAKRRQLDGVGFVFSSSDNIVGIDFDHCFNNGAPEQWVIDEVKRFNSYTHISPSGEGLHVFIRGILPVAGAKRGRVEAYQENRYFTITSHLFPGTPLTVEHRQAELDAFFATHLAPPVTPAKEEPEPAPAPAPASSVSLSDVRLIELASNAENGDKFSRLWRGDWKGTYASQSSADIALCNLLAFWTGKDAGRMDAMFRRSGLMRPKWDSKRGESTYGAGTIDDAIATTRETWPGPSLVVDTSGLTSISSGGNASPQNPEEEWPDPLAAEAFRGLAGEVVALFAPHTEADPTAVLVQFLTAFANAVGPTPHVMVGPTRHGTRMSAVIVGNTSRARKGDSWQCVRELFKHAEPDWLSRCVSTGLSTGEGLINVVKDGMIDLGQPGRVVGGEIDRRVLAVETEFGRTLRAMARDGNTLSAVLRDAWDGRDLAVMTRGTPLRATGAHIGIIGHVTVPELRRELSATDAHNGFANRFLWACAKRSRYLPDPSPVPYDDLVQLAARVTVALDAARRLGTLTRDDDTRALWRELYPALTHDHGGLAGDVLARSEAQVLRLSMLYALLDASPLIRPHHLTASVALWDYCAASVFHIFGAASGDGIADDILRFLERGGEHSRTDISNQFGRHMKSERVALALATLEKAKRIVCRTQETAGRSAELWRATGERGPTQKALLPGLNSLFSLISQEQGGSQWPSE